MSYGKRSAPSSVNKTRLPIGRRATVKSVCKTVEVKYRKAIIDAYCNKRDKLLISLLMETGMRIGQALQLRHEDIESWNSKIKMQYRRDNANGVYAKTKKEYYIHVSSEWLNAYSSMLINSDIDSDYLFTKLYRKDGGDRSEPLRYGAVKDLFLRISKKVDVYVRAHMYRHTHATDLLRMGVRIEIVSNRLGHASIETTKQAYEHLTAEDIKTAILDGQKNIDMKRKEYVVERITNI